MYVPPITEQYLNKHGTEIHRPISFKENSCKRSTAANLFRIPSPPFMGVSGSKQGELSVIPGVLVNWSQVQRVPTSGQVLMVWKLRFCLVFVSVMCLFSCKSVVF